MCKKKQKEDSEVTHKKSSVCYFVFRKWKESVKTRQAH